MPFTKGFDDAREQFVVTRFAREQVWRLSDAEPFCQTLQATPLMSLTWLHGRRSPFD